MQIVDSLVPIFSVIGLGVALRVFGFLTGDMTAGFNRFAYYVALPSFLFYKLGSAPAVGMTAQLFVVTLAVATLLTGVLSWLTTYAIGLNPRTRGAVIQASYRGNLAFIGLPLILFLSVNAAEDARLALEAAVLVALPPIVILYNLSAVAVLSFFSQDQDAVFSWKKVGFNILTNPLLIACVLGLLVQTSGLTIPTPVIRGCSIVGDAAFPLALLGVGSQLAATRVHHQWRNVLLVTCFKCVLCPIIGWLVSIWLGLNGLEQLAIIILAGTPTAISSYVLADQMNSDRELAAGAVVVCTATSTLTLSVILALAS